MELYVLDSNLKRIEVIDRFESLIWTERFQAYGDFELTLYSTIEARSLLKYNTMLACNRSNRVMIIEELENKTDSDGRKILSIKGSSLEKILQDRVACDSLSNLTSVLKGTFTVDLATDIITINNHNLITGDEVSITTTGKMPKVKVGDVTYISTVTDDFTVPNHNLITGDEVFLNTTGSLPTEFNPGTLYYAIVENKDKFQLASSYSNAVSNIPITIATGSSSTGTASLFSDFISSYTYFAIVISSNTIKLAYSYYDALVTGNSLDFSRTHTGIHSLYWVNGGKWRVKGTTSEIANSIYNDFCISGKLSSTDIIPLYSSGTLYPVDSISFPTTSYTIDIQITTVYDIIKQLCEMDSLGFRLYRNYDNGQIFFNIYSGTDRTTSQTTIDSVVFDLSLDTLLSDTEYISTRDLKNVAYVFSKNGNRVVYSNSADSTTTGFNKHVLLVNASDIDTEAGVTLDDQLDQRGQQELLKYRTITAFDGEITQYGNFVYEKDYRLGDLVEIRNVDGYGSIKRVTEQIFIDDMEGEKSYPTFSSELTITPGSWVSWDNAQTWADIPNDLDHEWQDL